MPLAITLAAAQSKLLSPEALLAHLEHERLGLLTRGTRDAPARQQTLHNTIRWSYDLLSDEEQILFRRLATFAGGCNVESARVLCTTPGGLALSILDGLSALLDNSLLTQQHQPGQEPRFIMGEVLREFGLDLLATTGELEACLDAHAAYFLGLAERAAPALQSAEQGRWRERLECERDNIWAALHWFLYRGRIEEAFRLGIALQRFWVLQRRLDGGCRFIAQVLEAASRSATHVSAIMRAEILSAAGKLACWEQDLKQAIPLLEESLSLFRSLQQAFSIQEDRDAASLPLPQPAQLALPAELTPREAEVLKLIATGLSNSRIADRLVLSPHTVGVHVQSIYRKLNINSRSAATRFALEHHLT